jgi:hypothetical protein
MLAFAGCKRDAKKEVSKPVASVAASAIPVASGVPYPREAIVDAVNHARLPVYSGPAGAVRGTIRIQGDPAPEVPEIARQIRDDCAPAREMYSRLFREGPGRTLPDVLVAVTGYDGYVPTQASSVEVAASNCAWSARTIALTFGQRLDVRSKDHKAYVPDLLGAQMPAQLIALPGGAGSSLYPQAPGRYVLVDSMRLFTAAEVLVLRYATHAVTGLDGQYEIQRIPAGKVTLNALLPFTGETLERTIEIKPSQTLSLDLAFTFNEAAWREAKAKEVEEASRSPKPGVSAPAARSASPK